MFKKTKHNHEILDPIHGFIHLNSKERAVVDSRPFQRLRHIHQLGLSYLVYPGATHRRFEHSLGVMKLADQVFDVITKDENLSDDIRDAFGELQDRERWKTTVRMAALCHDMGHTPLSHATEPLLPPGTDHEDVTYDIISHDDLKSLWRGLGIYGEDIAKLAIGPEKLNHQEFTPWEIILSDIITGDFFGVDRMDYLLRDSHHLGVTYGRFDHDRVIQSLRLLATPPEEEYSSGPILGIEEGGLGAAEGMSLARYFMYSQVYMHPICRIYEIHLREFMKDYLQDGHYPDDLEAILSLTDNQINAALADAALDQEKSGHQSARIITTHDHYRLIYERDDTLDQERIEESTETIFRDICHEFGEKNCRHDRYFPSKTQPNPFFIKKRHGEIVSASKYSQIFKNLPIVRFDRLYVAPSITKKVSKFLDQRKRRS